MAVFGKGSQPSRPRAMRSPVIFWMAQVAQFDFRNLLINRCLVPSKSAASPNLSI